MFVDDREKFVVQRKHVKYRYPLPPRRKHLPVILVLVILHPTIIDEARAVEQTRKRFKFIYHENPPAFKSFQILDEEIYETRKRARPITIAMNERTNECADEGYLNHTD